jgi:hypothetical protein
MAGLLQCQQSLLDTPLRRINMLTILFILLVLALVGGGVGHSRFGYAGWSPAGILIVVLLVLFLTGNRL